MLTIQPVVMHNLSFSLFELSEVLKKSEKITNPRDIEIMNDARLHIFMHCFEAFEEILSEVFTTSGIAKIEENPEDQGAVALDVLVRYSIISQDHRDKLSILRDCASLFAFDRAWLDKNEGETFDLALSGLTYHYYILCSFLKEIEHHVDDNDDLFALESDDETEELYGN